MSSKLERKRKSTTNEEEEEEAVKATKSTKRALPHMQKLQAVKRIIQQYGKVSTQLIRCFETFLKIEEEIVSNNLCLPLMRRLVGGVVKIPGSADTYNLFMNLVVQRDIDSNLNIDTIKNGRAKFTKAEYKQVRKERKQARYEKLLGVLRTFVTLLEEKETRLVRLCLAKESNNCWEYVLNMGQVFDLFWCSETGTPKEKCGIAEDQIVAYNRAIFFRLRHFLLGLETTLAHMKSEEPYFRKCMASKFQEKAKLKQDQFQELLRKVEIATSISKWNDIHGSEVPVKPDGIDSLDQAKQVNLAQMVVAPLVTTELLGGQQDKLRPMDEVLPEGIALREALEKHFQKKDRRSSAARNNHLFGDKPSSTISTKKTVQTFDLEGNGVEDGPTIVGIRDFLSLKTSRLLNRFYDEEVPFVRFPTSGGYGRAVVTEVPYPNSSLRESRDADKSKSRESTETRDVSTPIKVEVSSRQSIYSVPPEPIERLLLQLAHAIIDKYVANIQLLLDCWGIEVGDMHAQMPNGAIVKFGKEGFYGGHQDTSPILVSDEDETRVPCKFNGKFLPTQRQMFVATFVLGDQQHGSPNANVVWAGSAEAVNKASKEMADLTTTEQVGKHLKKHQKRQRDPKNRIFGALLCEGVDYCHLQFMNVNDTYTAHEGKQEEEKISVYHGSHRTGGYSLNRGIITFRMFLTTKDGDLYRERVKTTGGSGAGEKDYVWTRVSTSARKWEGSTGCLLLDTNDDDVSVSSKSVESQDLDRPTFSKGEVIDRYPRLPPAKLELFFDEGDPVTGSSSDCPPISCLAQLHSTNSSESTRFIQWLSSKWVAVNAFTDHATIFHSNVDNVDITSIPTHPHFKLPCYPGQTFMSSEFKGFIEVGDRRKEFASSSPAKANWATAQHLFKQNGKSYAAMERNADHFRETMDIIFSKCIARMEQQGIDSLPTFEDVLSELKSENISINSLFDVNLSLILTGSGGSSVDSGSNPGNVARMRRDDAVTRAPCNQNIAAGPNHAMDQNYDLERVIGCMMNTTTFSSKTSEGEDKLKYLFTGTIANRFETKEDIPIPEDQRRDKFCKLAAEYFLADKEMSETKKDEKWKECKQYVKKNIDFFTYRGQRHWSFKTINVIPVKFYVKIYVLWKHVEKYQADFTAPFKFLQVPSSMEFNSIKVSYDDLQNYFKKEKGTDVEINVATAKGIGNDITMECYSKLSPPGWLADLADNEDTEDKALDSNKLLQEAVNDNNSYKMDLKEIMNVGLLVNGASSLRSDMNKIMYRYDDAGIYSAELQKKRSTRRKGSTTGKALPHKRFAGYLKGKQSRHFHSTLRSKPTPMCARGLDINVSYIRYWISEALKKPGAEVRLTELTKLECNKDGQLKKASCEKIIEALFMSTLFIFTGKLAYFDDYKRQLNSKVSTAVPMRKDVDWFLEYLLTQFETEGNESNNPSVSRLVSAQHNAMIPDALKRYAGFSKFLSQLARKIEDFDFSRCKSRGEVLRSYTTLVMSCVDARVRSPNLEKFEQLCNFAMLNVEEVFDRPFGEILSAADVAIGFGGLQGLIIARILWEVMVKMRKSSALSLQKARLQIIHEHIFEHLKEHKDNSDYLYALGWRLERKGNVDQFVSIVNGRYYNVADTEHLLCKVWVLVASCHCGRSSSRHPNPTVPHCWPAVNVGNSDQGWYDYLLPLLKEVANKCLDLQENCNELVEYPPCLLRNGEELVSSWLAKRKAMEETEREESVLEHVEQSISV